jgi:phosphohistidine phosphatase SixA
MLYLIRHAHAGNKRKWDGPDDLRPLSDRGLREADGLVRLLAGHPIDRIRSSPALRCTQTVEPLAATLGLPITGHDGLAVGAPVDDLLEVMRGADADGLALCTHGELISEVFDRLLAAGLATDAEPRWQKGSVWLLDNLRSGAPVGRYLPPGGVPG